MSWGHRVAPMMQGIFVCLVFCRDSVSVFCFPTLLSFLRMGIDNAQSQFSGHSPSESCRSLQRQCNNPAVSPVNYHEVQRHIVLYNQPLPHPDPLLLG